MTTLGYKFSQGSKEKIGAASRKYWKKRRELGITNKKRANRKGIAPWNKGIKYSDEMRRQMSQTTKRLVREGRHNNYKGGITEVNKQVRNSVEYKLWRTAVFTRDNFKCTWCLTHGTRANPIEADHIKPFALFPELRFSIDNGRTLCKECHKCTDTWGWKKFLEYKMSLSIEISK